MPAQGAAQGDTPGQVRPLCFFRDARKGHVQILLNGKACETRAEVVSGLVVELGLDAARIAVILNDRVVARAARATTAIQDGDRVEVLTFVAGG